MEGLIYRNLYDEDGAIVSNDGKILYKVPDITHYRIKEGVEEIDKHAFKNCPHLKEVDIPYTVQWYIPWCPKVVPKMSFRCEIGFTFYTRGRNMVQK